MRKLVSGYRGSRGDAWEHSLHGKTKKGWKGFKISLGGNLMKDSNITIRNYQHFKIYREDAIGGHDACFEGAKVGKILQKQQEKSQKKIKYQGDVAQGWLVSSKIDKNKQKTMYWRILAFLPR